MTTEEFQAQADLEDAAIALGHRHCNWYSDDVTRLMLEKHAAQKKLAATRAEAVRLKAEIAELRTEPQSEAHG